MKMEYFNDVLRVCMVFLKWQASVLAIMMRHIIVNLVLYVTRLIN